MRKPELEYETISQSTSIAVMTKAVHSKWSPAGVFLCGIASLFFSVSTLSVKLALPHFSFLSIMIFRSLGQSIFGALTFYVTSKLNGTLFELWGPVHVRHFVIIRGIFGAVSLGLAFFTISQLPLGDATAILFLAPIMTAIIAYFWLDESWLCVHTISTFIGSIGVCFIARPPFLFDLLAKHNGFDDMVAKAAAHDESSNTLNNALEISLSRFSASLLGCLGSFVTALAYVTIRKAGKDVHFLSHVTSFGVISLILSLLVVPLLSSYSVIWDYFLKAPFIEGWIPQLTVCITAFLAQCCLNAGLQKEKAGVAAFLKSFEVVLSFIFQAALLGNIPTLMSIVGAVLVMCATLMIVFETWRTSGNGSSNDIAANTPNETDIQFGIDLDEDDKKLSTVDNASPEVNIIGIKYEILKSFDRTPTTIAPMTPHNTENEMDFLSEEDSPNVDISYEAKIVHKSIGHLI